VFVCLKLKIRKHILCTSFEQTVLVFAILNVNEHKELVEETEWRHCVAPRVAAECDYDRLWFFIL